MARILVICADGGKVQGIPRDIFVDKLESAGHEVTIDNMTHPLPMESEPLLQWFDECVDFDLDVYERLFSALSIKRRAREQRRMDWESNVRRRKRRKELQRRERG